MIKWIISGLLLLGCSKPAQQEFSTSNSAFEVEMLFEHEGCKVYRFTDSGLYRYFTSCEGGVSWTEKCGKTCHRDVEVPTEDR